MSSEIVETIKMIHLLSNTNNPCRLSLLNYSTCGGQLFNLILIKTACDLSARGIKLQLCGFSCFILFTLVYGGFTFRHLYACARRVTSSRVNVAVN